MSAPIVSAKILSSVPLRTEVRKGHDVAASRGEVIVATMAHTGRHPGAGICVKSSAMRKTALTRRHLKANAFRMLQRGIDRAWR
jgi:ATP-dependent phosphoenolpyruvate carboxykinase